MCKLILENVDEKNPNCLDGISPLHVAAENGHLAICELIMNNLEVNYKGFYNSPKTLYGETPLHFAAKNGHLKVCQLFLENCTHKNPKNEFGETPLHFAAQNGHFLVSI